MDREPLISLTLERPILGFNFFPSITLPALSFSQPVNF
jgi:hypothetical protein